MADAWTEDEDQSVCVIGLGYVGLTLAVVMASLGFKIMGVEVRADVVERLKNGDPHFFEPNLRQMLARVLKSGNLVVCDEIPESCECSAYVITVGTPLTAAGTPRLDSIQMVSEQIAKVRRPRKLVILRSTVCVGATRQIVAPVLAKAKQPFQIAFCPERTVEGKALSELRILPQIVGAEDHATRQRASRLFYRLTPTVVQVSQPETAELIKLVDNTYRDISFAFANEVAELCDALGISASEVISSGKLNYARTSVPQPGPVGGPCLEKDPHILNYSAELVGRSVTLASAARRINEEQPARVVGRLMQYVRERPPADRMGRIAVLGLAFKGRPVTGDLRGTMALPIVLSLKNAFPEAELALFDPVSDPAEVVSMFGIDPCESIESAVHGASLVVITTNHPMFSDLDLSALSKSLPKRATVYDFWGQFDPAQIELANGVSYIMLGDGNLD